MTEYLVVGKQTKTKRLQNGRLLGAAVYCETLTDTALLARNFRTNGTYSDVRVIEIKEREISQTMKTLDANIIQDKEL
jgi:hypothetical protein